MEDIMFWPQVAQSVAGISYRRLDNWSKPGGFVEPKQAETGEVRFYSFSQIIALTVVGHLRRIGLDTATCHLFCEAILKLPELESMVTAESCTQWLIYDGNSIGSQPLDNILFDDAELLNVPVARAFVVVPLRHFARLVGKRVDEAMNEEVDRQRKRMATLREKAEIKKA